MSIVTKIQWVDSTCNPTMGCEGCELWNPKIGVRTCYAGTLHTRFGGVTKGYSPTFDELTFWPGRMADAAQWPDLIGTTRLNKPWLDRLPRLIFVSDMSDALSSAVPFDFLEAEVITNVTSPIGQRHHWLWLTKRPDRMSQFSEMLKAKGIRWPKNLWAGTSITSQATTGRIKHLLRVGDEDTIRFLSVEPQHEAIRFGELLPRLDWVIQGGESGPGAAPFRLEWVVDLIRLCGEVHVAYFLKQLGSNVWTEDRRITFEDGHAGDWSEWPKNIRVRQMPDRIRTATAGKLPRLSLAINGSLKTEKRLPLPMIGGQNKGTLTALKALATRRKNKQEKAGKASKSCKSNKESSAG